MKLKLLIRKRPSRKVILLFGITLFVVFSLYFVLTRPQKPHVDGEMQVVNAEKTQTSAQNKPARKIVPLREKPTFVFRFVSRKGNKAVKKVDFARDTMTLTLHTPRGKSYILPTNLTKNEEKGWFPKTRAQEQSLPTVTVQDDPQGSFSLSLPELSSLPEAAPGKYTLHISWENDESVVTAAQDFSWGVLVMNTEKDVYTIGDTVIAGIGVIDERGNTVCDAKIEVRIMNQESREEIFSTENGKVTNSKDCGPNTVTNNPDYAFEFKAETIGEYILTLTAETKNGVASITQKLKVENKPTIAITRNAPSRIYPLAKYSSKFKVQSSKLFEGDIVETVPDDFVVTDCECEQETVGGKKELLWKNETIDTGKEKTFSYTYDAPDRSPDLFILGPVRLTTHVILNESEGLHIDSSPSSQKDKDQDGSLDYTVAYTEQRSWFIASDAVTSIRPDGNGTIGTFTSTNANAMYSEVDDDPDSSTDTDYIEGPNNSNTQMYLTLGAMPADFSTATSVEIKAKHAEIGAGNDRTALEYSIVQSDESTAITAETVFGDMADNQTGTPTYETDTATVSITGTNNLATWNAARLKIRQATNQVSGPDNDKGRITAVEVNITYTPIPVVNQYGYRIRSDDGAENAGSSLVAENTAYTTANTGVPVRVRFTVNNTGATATNYTYRLEYALQGAACSSASYTTVPDSPTSEPFDMVTTSNYADGDASTNVSAGSGVMTDPGGGSTFTAGKLVESTSNTTGAITLTQDHFTEVEYAIQPNSNVSFNTAYCFRLSNAGAALDTYTNYPQITVIPAAVTTFNQRQGIVENDQNGTNTSNTVKIGERMKVKIQVDTGSGDYSYTRYKLQYDKNDSNWVDVNPSSEIRAARSEVIKSEKNTGTGDAGSCTGGVTAYPGYWTSEKAVTKTLKMYGSSCRDIGFVIDTKNATANTTYRFRLVDQIGSTTTYVAYPSFTTVASGSNTKRYSKSNTVANASSYDDLKHLLDNQGYSNVGTDDSTREILQNTSSDTTADQVMTGEATTNSFGTSVASAGDVNGDGYSDVVVGASGYNPGGASNTGRAYIYYGGSSMDATADVVMTGAAASDTFGTSVASAGDVNGDGYNDVIIGANGYNPGGAANTGRAYIYYGGSSMDVTADVVMTGAATTDTFGTSVASAGDVNGDGYADVIVGADGYSSVTGRSYIYFGGSSMNTTADVVMTGEAANNSFGISVASAGDVNGDGYSDVIVGAYAYDPGGAVITGRSYIYNGGSSMNATADVVMTGVATNNRFGLSVASAGDVNGDGYSDVIVGANGFSTNTGRTYIYNGGSSMDSTADVVMTGEVSGDRFGGSVNSVGDVNGDGYADVIVGALVYSTNTGRAYIYYGGSSMNATSDVVMTGEATSSNFGTVAPTGDVNGDGYSDVVVGASGYDIGTNDGRAYIYYQGYTINSTFEKTITGTNGSNFGVSSASAGDVNGDGYADIIVGTNTGDKAYIYYGGLSMDTTADVTLTGDAGTAFGTSVGSAGDVNGDGYADVSVSETAFSSNAGRVYVYYGSSSMDSTADVAITGEASSQLAYFNAAGDVNGDGYSDIVLGTPVYSSSSGRVYIFYGSSSLSASLAASAADKIITGSASSSFGGAGAVGDVNGDGYSDVIVGATAVTTSTGQVYIYYGSSSMDTTVDVTITGETTNNLFGSSVALGGDVNGDGYSDILIGATSWDNGASTDNTGRLYVFYGSSNLSSSFNASVANLIFTGEASGVQLGFAATSGDMNGDGYADILVSAKQYSSITGRAYVYYGSSFTDTTADFTFTGVATIDQFGSSLTVADVNNDGYIDSFIGAQGFDVGAGTNDGRMYLNLGGGSTYIPTYTFADKSSSVCSGLTSIDATWNGQSNVAAGTKNILLQVYRFGATNAWETVTTNSALAADTDGNITGSMSSSLSEYCDGSNWSYWRVYQASGTENLKTDYWNLTFTGGVSDTQSTTIRGGVNFRGGTTIR